MANFALINDFNSTELLDTSLQNVRRFLTEFATDGIFHTKIETAFGNNFNTELLAELNQSWKTGNFAEIPTIEIRRTAELNGLNGAFFNETNTIYLSQDYLTQNAANSSAITDVLLHEIGHFIDSKINVSDTPGEEGEIFSALVQGQTLDNQQLQQLRTQNNSTTITLDGRTIPLEAAGYTPDLSLLASYVKPLLEKIKTSINAQVPSLPNLPLIGNFPLQQYVNGFITQQLETNIFNALNNGQAQTVSSVQNALFNALNPIGLLQDYNKDGSTNVNDIVIDTDSNSYVEFKFKIGQQPKPSIPLAGDIGVPGLNLKLDGKVNPALDLGLELGFGVQDNKGTPTFFVDTNTSKFSTGLNVNLAGSNLTGTFGFLNINAQDKGSNSQIGFSANLTSPKANPPNGRVNINQIQDINSIGLAKTQPSGNTNLNLNLTTGLDSNGKLIKGMPSISSDFYVKDWQYGSNSSTSPKIGFENASLDSGKFIASVAAPILESIKTVTDPFNPFINALTEELPIIGNSLLDLAGVDQTQQAFIKQLADIIDLAAKIPSNGGSYKIDLGNYSISGGVQNTNNLLQSAQTSSPTVVAPLATSLTNQEFIKKLEGLGFQFPLLKEPSKAFGLFLGKDVDLFTYEPPSFGFQLNLPSISIPVFGPIEVEFNAGLAAGFGFKFGYDTKGLREFAEGKSSNASDIFTKGLYVSKPSQGLQLGSPYDDKPHNISLSGEATASVGVDVAILEAHIGGGFKATVGFDAIGKSGDGKARLYDFSKGPLCMFAPYGALSAIIFGSITLDLGLFEVSKRLDLANINLIDFQGTGCEDPDPKSHYNVEPNPEELDEETKKFLVSRGLLNRKGTDDRDRITLTSKGENDFVDNTEDVLLQGLDSPKDKLYEGISTIAIDGGRGDDIIQLGKGNDPTDLDDVVFTPAQLKGGEGNDTLIGGDGDDFLEGGAGEDYLNGGGGKHNTASYAHAEKGVKVDLANSNNNAGDAKGDRLVNIQQLEGSKHADSFIGDAKDNLLDTGDGNDNLEGGDGDDKLLGGKGADTIDGGKGTDSISYFGSKAGVYVNLSTTDLGVSSPTDGEILFLAANSGVNGEANGDVLKNIENLQGSSYDDILVGSNDDNYDSKIDGFAGNDIVFAGAAQETLSGGSGIDWISYSNSKDGVDVHLINGDASGGYADGDELVRVKNKDKQDTNYNTFENLEGSNFNDTLEGDFGSNILRGLLGNDELLGNQGNDTLIGGAGADILNGGGGIDWADYSDSANGVTVDLNAGKGFNGDAEQDQLFQIENLRGSDNGDLLIGDIGDNEIDPGLSNGAVDTVSGGSGNDRLIVDYSVTDIGVGITGGFQNTATGSGLISRKAISTQDEVSFSGIERLYIIGTTQGDRIIGGSNDDVLLSGAGNDSINGGRGNDVIRTGDGKDVVIAQDVQGKFIGNPGNSFLVLDGGTDIDTLSVDLSGQVDQQGKSFDIVLESTNPDGENANQLLSLSNGTAIQNFEVFKDINTSGGSDRLTQLGRINNNFNTGAGNDIVNAGLGFDTVDGGSGTSTPDDDLLIIDYSVGDIGSGMTMFVNRNQPSGAASRNVSDFAGQSQSLDQVGFINFERYQVTGTSKDDSILTGDGNDTVSGGAGKDTIIGGRGNDSLVGGDGHDVLMGTNNATYKDIDTLTGGAGADTFILGDARSLYYATSGNQDYALITDFNLTEDVIQLRGSGTSYFLNASPDGTDTEIYRGVLNGPGRPELIGIVQDVSNLSLTGNYFSFV